MIRLRMLATDGSKNETLIVCADGSPPIETDPRGVNVWGCFEQSRVRAGAHVLAGWLHCGVRAGARR